MSRINPMKGVSITEPASGESGLTKARPLIRLSRPVLSIHLEVRVAHQQR